ncbi:MAG: Lrp/AsnC family transcriptional regulator [Myxococcota bacterium]
MSSLDQKDHQLLRLLKKNARTSLASLARSIGLSRSATHDRVTRLEERGVIQGYTIKIDRAALPSVRAFISLCFVAAQVQNELASVIHAMPGVEGAYCLSGDIDMIVYCECDSLEELNTLRDRLSGLAGVTELSTRPVLASSVS